MGLLPVEFILRDLIDSEIKAVKADPTLLNEILEGYTTNTKGGAALLSMMEEYFSEASVRVIIGWPRDVSTIPCVAISIDDKRESQKFLGGYIDTEVLQNNPEDEDEVTGYEDLVGSYFQASYRMTCLEKTGDVVIVLAAIVETALMRNRLVLNDNGIRNNEIQVSDNMPLPEYIPNTLYNRSVTLTCSVATTSRLLYPTIKDVTVVPTVL